MLLGTYRPRLLLLTTPNYTYNQRFTRPGVFSSTGIPDPTKRTNRVFRHPDHKFEWTEEEWVSWCTVAAEAHGYSVDCGGLGKCVEKDEWDRDELVGFASQTALFRRKSNAPTSEPPAYFPAAGTGNAHTLLARHLHEPHPSSGMQRPAAEILEGLKRELVSANVDHLTVSEFWSSHAVSILCGGNIVALLDSIHSDPSNDWEFDTSNKKPTDTIWEVVVRNKSFVPEERPSLWGDDDEWVDQKRHSEPIDHEDEQEEQVWTDAAPQSSEHFVAAAAAGWGEDTSAWRTDEAGLSSPRPSSWGGVDTGWHGHEESASSAWR